MQKGRILGQELSCVKNGIWRHILRKRENKMSKRNDVHKVLIIGSGQLLSVRRGV